MPLTGLPVLPYTIKTNVPSHHACLQEIRDFAAANGWTNLQYLSNVAWGSVGGGQYGFVAGSESFLILESPGYGNQVLHYRFRCWQNNLVSNHEWLEVGAFRAGTTNIITTSSTHPVANQAWNPDRFWSVNPNQINKLHLFGNEKHIIVVFEFDPNTISVLFFGSPVLLDLAGNELNALPNVGTGIATYYWFNRSQLLPFDSFHQDYLGGSIAITNTNMISDVMMATGDTLAGGLLRYGRILLSQNSYTKYRPILQSNIYTNLGGDNKWRLVAQLPVGRINTEGLIIGERLKYGTEEFIAFPQTRRNEWNHGFAVRVV